MLVQDQFGSVELNLMGKTLSHWFSHPHLLPRRQNHRRLSSPKDVPASYISSELRSDFDGRIQLGWRSGVRLSIGG
jgi:hypothetical protein